MKKSIWFIGMDVHLKKIDITVAEQGHDGKVWHFGCIGGDLKSLDKAVDKLAESGAELRFVYEAGPSGYVIYRHLKKRGLACTVVSPASIPKKASDRVKTDRRDSHKLAIQHRAGTLRGIYIPEPEDEAMRDLVRAREDAVYNRREARQRLTSFLLRHGRNYTGGKKKWNDAHRRWLAEQRFDHQEQRVTMEEYLGTIKEAEERVDRLSEQIQLAIPKWRLKPYVYALQALRGVSWIVAVTVVAEVGDLTRFRPRQLMAFLGIVPKEYTSSDKRRLGAITKTGNAHVRRALCEAAWAYVHRAAVTAHLLKRQKDLPAEICAIAWKAQLRLCARFRHLTNENKHRNKINTAIARELVAFMWDIACHVAKLENDPTAFINQAQPEDVIVLRRRPKARSKKQSAKRVRNAA